MPTHQELDQRSLALHRLVADKMRHDAVLLERAKSILARWFQTTSPRTHVYLSQWQQLLEQDLDACLAVATEDTERAAALRQASPLACLLTNQERFAFLKSWSAEHASHGT